MTDENGCLAVSSFDEALSGVSDPRQIAAVSDLLTATRGDLYLEIKTAENWVDPDDGHLGPCTKPNDTEVAQKLAEALAPE